MEFIVELLLEFLIQIFGEALFELGLRSVMEPFRKRPNRWFAVIGYTIFGATLGGISLWPFPHHMVRNPAWRAANLFATPFAAGLCMSLLGAWRSRRGQAIVGIDRFWYGALFALAFAVVRFVWAR